jgi:hypothetical protein
LGLAKALDPTLYERESLHCDSFRKE